MNLRFLLLLLLCVSVNAFSQAANYAILSGKITYPVNNQVSMYLVTDLLTNEKTIISTPVNPDGTFILAYSASQPMLVRIEHAYENMVVYLVPGERMSVTFEAERMWETIRFEGQGADNNNYLAAFFNQFEKEIDQTYIDINAEGMSAFQYSKYVNERKNRQLGFLKQYMATHTFTHGFENYARGDIIYNWAYDRLRYAVMHKWLLEDLAYYEFLNNMPIQDDALIASNVYTKFLLAYTDYQQYVARSKRDVSLINLSPYAQKYELVNRTLSGNLKYYILAKLLATACEKGAADDIAGPYKDFVNTNPYPSYAEYVGELYSVAVKFSAGQPAPDFTLTDLYGSSVSLSDFRGKVVYIAFWASWCRPCIQQIKYIKQIEQELNSDEIVFLYVSIDEDDTAWRNMVAKKQIPGVHVRTSGVKSIVPRDYNVAGVPVYFMVDKDGKFAKKPPRPSIVDKFKTQAESLMSAK